MDHAHAIGASRTLGENSAASDTLKNQQPRFTVVYNGAIGILSPFAMAIYVVICFHANNSTKESYPGHERIAREARCSRSQVKRAIAELVKKKLISVRKVGRVGMQHNEYTVLQPASTQAKRGGAVPTGPGYQKSKDGPSRAGTRSCQSPELDLPELDLEQGEQGITDVMVPHNSQSSKKREVPISSAVPLIPAAEKSKSRSTSKTRAPRSSREAWTSAEWQQLREHLAEEQFTGIDYRDNVKRDRGALRSLCAVTNGADQACELLDQASDQLSSEPVVTSFHQLIAVATGLAERENGTSCSRTVAENAKWKAAAKAAGMTLAEFAGLHPDGLPRAEGNESR